MTETIYPGWIYSELLSEKQCKYYQKTIDTFGSPRSNYIQDIIKLPKLTEEVWEIIKHDLPNKISLDKYQFRLIGLSDHITISRHSGKHIGIHRDSDVNISYHGRTTREYVCLYKLAIYLNDLSDPNNPNDTTGGTKFYDSSKKYVYTIKPGTGKAVLFDMREWHSGGYVPRGETKYMLGLRPIYENLGPVGEEHRSDSGRDNRKNCHQSGPVKENRQSGPVKENCQSGPVKENRQSGPAKENRQSGPKHKHRKPKSREYYPKTRKYCHKCRRYHS